MADEIGGLPWHRAVTLAERATAHTANKPRRAATSTGSAIAERINTWRSKRGMSQLALEQRLGATGITLEDFAVFLAETARHEIFGPNLTYFPGRTW
jgi:ribosome-binding protein aMBF1 (putative translation factor)